MLSLFGSAAMTGGQVRDRDRRPPAPPLNWWVVAAALIVVAGVAWGATALLLHEADGAKDPAAARVDAIRTGLTIAAGAGGVFAFLLAVRRQWHQEFTAVDVMRDAEARRITELYTKAADQLGSEKAAVRLAGLYALERLAQDNPGQRQTIVNVICAYLRMPFEMPGEPPVKEAAQIERIQFDVLTQELEVRLTAQNILAAHLRTRPAEDHEYWLTGMTGLRFERSDEPKAGTAVPDETFWAEINLDLRGATLSSFALIDCRVASARFVGTRFVGGASFDRTRFDGTAWFTRAQFEGTAWFDGAQFSGDAMFQTATFSGDMSFQTASGLALFADARFLGSTWFLSGTISPGEALWVRLDVPAEVAKQRYWPNGSHVVPTRERPAGENDGEWGKLLPVADD